MAHHLKVRRRKGVVTVRKRLKFVFGFLSLPVPVCKTLKQCFNDILIAHSEPSMNITLHG